MVKPSEISATAATPMPVGSPERLGYWYLRLNGFLLLENFIVHPDIGGNQRTDADLVGIRLAHRSENQLRPMRDDPRLSQFSTLMCVVIAEVKTGRCSLNGPWTRKQDENIHRVLRAIGCFPESAISIAAEQLYEEGVFQTSDCTCRLLAFGDSSAKLAIGDVKQILFNEMLDFIYDRFQEYHDQKASVGNWPEDGRRLATLARNSGQAEFRKEVRQGFGLPANPPRGE